MKLFSLGTVLLVLSENENSILAKCLSHVLCRVFTLLQDSFHCLLFRRYCSHFHVHNFGRSHKHSRGQVNYISRRIAPAAVAHPFFLFQYSYFFPTQECSLCIERQSNRFRFVLILGWKSTNLDWNVFAIDLIWFGSNIYDFGKWLQYCLYN